jgi:hypothetical protein
MCVEEEVGQLEGNVDGIDSGDWLPSPRYSGVCLELVGRGKLRLEGNITVRGGIHNIPDWLPSPRYSGMCLELVDRAKLRLEGVGVTTSKFLVPEG